MKKTLREIDTSYWHTKDRRWMLEREAKWLKIEFMLRNYKASKAIRIIKAYYLKGKMPNWKALEEWRDESRHVDLFIFLWLHPSWDLAVLSELRNFYINSYLIVRNDLSVGFHNFLVSQSVGLTNIRESDEQVDCPYLEGYGELLFRVILGDPIEINYEIKSKRLARLYGAKYQVRLPVLDLICTMGGWLVTKNMLPASRDFLYQYDQPLEWWYRSSSVIEDQYYKADKPSLREALYRIHHFDTEKEGDTCRTQFVHKIREILDEREFVADFKHMWNMVKAGKVVVENAWKL